MRSVRSRMISLFGLLLIAALSPLPLFRPALAQAPLTGIELQPNDPFGQGFGGAAALSGNFAIVGAPYDNQLADDAGAAYIFEKNGNSWNQVAKLTNPSANNGDLFGWAVDISGDYAIVGEPKIHVDGVQGAAFIYMRDGNGNWVLQTTLSGIDGPEDRFGTAVAMEGNNAVIGAPGELYNSPTPGVAYIFQNNGVNWTLSQQITSRDPKTNADIIDDAFGTAVNISGNRVVVGAPADFPPTGSPGWEGAAYIFEKTTQRETKGGGTWQQTARLIKSNRQPNDFELFGSAVSISGDYALISADGVGFRHDRTGAAFVFHFNSTTQQWEQQATLNPTRSDSYFGDAVFIQGSKAIISDAPQGLSSFAYIFERSGNSWTQTGSALMVSNIDFDGGDDVRAVQEDANAYIDLVGELIIAGSYVYSPGDPATPVPTTPPTPIPTVVPTPIPTPPSNPPEIRVIQTATGAELSDGSTFAFPTTNVDNLPISRLFNICNDGTGDLTIDNPGALVSGTGFTQIGPPPVSPVAPGACTSFRVRFHGTKGAYSGAITIGNNDADENPYDIALQGTTLPAANPPEIRVVQAATGVEQSDGSTFTFPTTAVADLPISRLFNICNDGTGDLNINNLSTLVSGVGFSQIGTPPVSPVAPGTCTSFRVRFHVANAGSYSGAITIGNNDLDENPYDITLVGTATQ